MLNTKSIKKKLFDEIEMPNNNRKNFMTDNNKILETNDSISSKEIIKLHNENLQNHQDGLKMMDNAIKQREMTKFMDNFNDNFKGGDENLSQNINSLQINNNPVNNTQEGGNILVRELANQIKNDMRPNPQIILVAPQNNSINECNISKRNSVEWDDVKNAYVIYENDIVDGYFTNNDIIKSVINGNNINKNVKKYFFIIANNAETDNNEFNFIDSIFTDNLDLVIKIQNEIFDIINQNDFIEKNENDLENLLIFNYQFIIYLFKKFKFLDNNESNKIAKFYSTLTFRFSSLILKQLVKIENRNINIINDVAKLHDVKKDISSQLNNIENYLENLHNKKETIQSNISDSSSKSKSNDNSDTIINISTSDNNSTDDINKNSQSGSLSNKNETEKTSILDEIISSLSNKKSNQNNGYKEINDDVTSYIDKQFSGNLKTSVTSITSNTNKKNTYKITNKHTSTSDPSYNKSSAIKNGQIYKIKL
jgi:hypothetical protein